MSSLAGDIARFNRDRLDEYMPLLREVCERLLKESGDSVMRRNAVRYMCLVCEEEEVKDWLNADTRFIQRERIGILEERYLLLGNRDKYLTSHYAANLEAVIRLLDREVHNPYRTADDSVNWQRMCIQMIKVFGDGSVPDGWMYWYILTRTRLAAALCGRGETEQGLHELEEVLLLVKQWYTVPDGTLLKMGGSTFFGEIKMKKNDFNHAYASDGTGHFLVDLIANSNFDLYACLTQPNGLEWFDPVRNDPRFIAVAEHAKVLGESLE